MTDIPQKNDPSSQWPEEVRQAYEHLKVPSLYESVLINEKLSLEIRRQGRELKSLSEAIQALTTQVNSVHDIVSEEWHEYEATEGFEGTPLPPSPSPQDGFKEYRQGDLTDLEVQLISERQAYLEKQSLDALMESHDAVRELSRMARQITHQLMTLLPKKEGLIGHVPTWYPIVEQLVYGFIEAVDRSRLQLLTGLEEMHIELIEPQPGDPFNESLHHVLETVVGGPPGTIEKVIRAGYRQDDQVLRFADVVIYR